MKIKTIKIKRIKKVKKVKSEIFKMKMVFIIFPAIFFIILFLSSTSYANVDSDLDNFFNGLGYESNTTAAGAYQDQAAGYYTGGSLFLRNQVKDYQLVSVQLPSFSGGCSGIDTFLGSFSVISSDNIVQMMKNIMSSAGAYAFDLALTTTIPQIKTVKDALQKYMQDINNMNINSCNTAEDLVGGMWPKTQQSQQQICKDVASRQDKLSDWASARQACGTGGQFYNDMNNPGDRSHEVVVNKNLVWDALKNNGLTASDPELSEMLMSLSGSIIITKDPDDDNANKKVLVSLAGSENIIKALLNGGTANIYHCDETVNCLNPTSNYSITVSQDHGLVSEVTTMISTLNAAVASDSGTLTQATRGFLEMTPLPVLKYITTSLALGKPINPTEFSNVIALSLLDQYLSENILLVQESLEQEDTQMNPIMEKRITDAQRLVAQKIDEAYHQLANVDVLINNMRANEQQLTSRLVDQASVGQESE